MTEKNRILKYIQIIIFILSGTIITLKTIQNFNSADIITYIFFEVLFVFIVLLTKKFYNKIALRVILNFLCLMLTFCALNIPDFYSLFEVSQTNQKHDKGLAAYLEATISIYIVESEDYNLSFMQNKELTVESLIKALQEEISYNGNIYGPYLKHKLLESIER